ncbi:alpha/beta fold hydrolase [Nonomuraea lactucae]|uniref:alpha/beta fold hydrolase n=1 Tax=Nonomuraea lactucae TaxID=2249762 RepID=UPI000DE2FF51|nr:alpha/beta hydrolase [Nonomuraea lactucae]
MPTIDVNGTTLYYEDDGPRDAPALVMSPSMFFDTRMFQAQADHFNDRYRVIRYDHRGQGRSARAPRDQLDYDTLTQDVVELIGALGIAPVVFVGNSMGGFVGLRLAARHPELLRSAVVMGTSADVEEQVEEMDVLIDVLGEHGMEPILEGLLTFMMGETTLNDPSRAHILAGVRQLLLSRGPEYADAAWHIPHRAGVLDELAAITVPLVVVAGTEDHTYPPEKSKQIVAGVPHAELVVMEHTGHVHALENPDGVIDLLERHLPTVV